MRISDWSSDVCSSDLPGIMRDGHASRGDIDDDLSVGALAIFPATMMVADGIFSKRRQGVLQLQCGTANVSTIVDGVMVAQHRRPFPDRQAAIGDDLTHPAFLSAPIIADVDALATILPPAMTNPAPPSP